MMKQKSTKKRLLWFHLAAGIFFFFQKSNSEGVALTKKGNKEGVLPRGEVKSIGFCKQSRLKKRGKGVVSIFICAARLSRDLGNRRDGAVQPTATASSL